MPNRVGESGLFPPEDFIGEIAQTLKGMAEQVFALSVYVAFHGGIDGHNVVHKIQIAEGDSGLQRIDTDTAVRPKHIVHMQFPQPLPGFLLEGLGGGGKIGVLVAEQLIGNLSGEEDPDRRGFVDGLANQIHSDAGPNGGDIEGSQQFHNRLQCVEYIFLGDYDLRVNTVDIIGDDLRVFQINGILAHADGEGMDGFLTFPGGNGADKRGIQPAGEQKSHLGVGYQTFADTGNQLFPDVRTDGFQIIGQRKPGLGNVAIAVEFPITVVMPGREGENPIHKPQQVLGLTGKHNGALNVIAIVQRTDTDGVPGGKELLLLPVIEDAGKFRVQHGEHPGAVFLIERQENLAVGIADEGVVFGKLPAEFFKPVDLTVADDPVPVQRERLHSFRVEAHNGKTVKT